MYPLDTIKTRLQSQDYLKTFSRSASSSQSPGNVFRGLYQGVGSVVIATLPAAGLFFTTYEATKPFYAGLSAGLPGGAALPTPLIHSLASGTAELASCLVLTPAEVIKQNAQMIRSSGGSSPAGGWRNSTSVQAFRKLVGPGDAGGPARRLLTGYTALVARNLPFTALQFPIFEALRQRIWESRDRRADATRTVKDGPDGVVGGERRVEQGAMARGLLETGYVNGVSAALSGAIAAVVTSPADTVKTRMMLFAGEERQQRARLEEQQEQRLRDPSAKAATGKAANHETQKQLENAVRRQGLNGVQVAKLIYQERGVYGLFRGGLLRAAWTAVGSGLYLGTYEVAKVWLKGSSGSDDTGNETL